MKRGRTARVRPRQISSEREAEELRSGLESLISAEKSLRTLITDGVELDDVVVEARDIQDLLDKVDARDSLYFLEQRAKRRRRKAGR